MSNRQAMERLTVSLTEAIQQWADDNCESDEWAEVGYVGEDSNRLMAQAAMAVLEAQAHVQTYLKAEGFLDA